MKRRTVAVLAAVVLMAIAFGIALSAAGPGTPDANPAPGRCGAATKEKLDSRSLQHVLPEATPPDFSSEQPTSGPHAPVERSGVQTEPLSPVLQVGLLEEGSIILQHQGLDDGALMQLEALAGPEVIVAPGRNLPDHVVATAWTYKLRCDRVEPDALERFIVRHKGNGPG